MRPVACIRNEVPDPGGTVVEELERESVPFRIVDAWKGEPLPAPEDIGGIVAFGGSMHANDLDRHPFLAAERDLLHAATERGTPVLGICLGGQILALAKGANLRPSPTVEFGYTPIAPTHEGERDALISVFEPGDRVFHWHEDTFDVPGGATLLAVGEAVRNQAFRYGETAWGVQFHPEITAEVLDGWLGVAGDTAVRWGKTAGQIREEGRLYLADEEKKARELIRRFADVVRAAGA